MRLILAAMLLTRVASAETVTFETAKIGSLPPGWTSAMTHSGGEPRWEVITDEGGTARHRYSRSCLKTKHLDDSPSQSTTRRAC